MITGIYASGDLCSNKSIHGHSLDSANLFVSVNVTSYILSEYEFILLWGAGYTMYLGVSV